MDLILYTLLFLICITVFLFLRKNYHGSANTNNIITIDNTRNKRYAEKNRIQSLKPIVKINNDANTALEYSVQDNVTITDDMSKNNDDDKVELPDDFVAINLVDTCDSIDQQKIESLLNKTGKPHPLLSSLCLNTSNSKELLNIIKKDPELVAKVINVANSPLFGLSSPITNLNHAIMFLGLIEVKSIATQFAVKDSLKFDNANQQKMYEKIWSAGFLAGCIAVEIARELNVDNAAHLASCCQLSYLGDLVMLFGDVDTIDLYGEQSDFLHRVYTIQKLYCVNQVIIASQLAKKWGLPEQIIDSISKNLQPFKSSQLGDDTEDKNTLLCYLSCRLADQMIFNGNLDILNCKQLSWKDTQCIEFAYTQKQLKELGLIRLNYIINSVAFRRKMLQYTAELKI